MVPCFNEEHRLRLDTFEAALAANPISILFVDDGSTDHTLDRITRWSAGVAHADILALSSNQGKGEAVREGLLAAIDGGAQFVGYLDADLATPIDELIRMHTLLDEQPKVEAVLGSRVALLGSRIERSRVRHIQGRVFATLASIALDLPIYDTQCGAKVFRTTPALRDALADPFRSRWAFDVDMLSRITDPTRPDASDVIIEMPLREWRDVAGSHLSIGARVQALAELGPIWWRRRAARR